MSRFTKTHETKPNLFIAYGLDHAIGYFYDVVDTDAPEESQLVEEKSTRFEGLTKMQMVEKLKEFNVKPDHITAVVLDIDFV